MICSIHTESFLLRQLSYEMAAAYTWEGSKYFTLNIYLRLQDRKHTGTHSGAALSRMYRLPCGPQGDSAATLAGKSGSLS